MKDKTVLILIALSVFFFILLCWTTETAAEKQFSNFSQKEIYVRYGDTLWGYAEQYAPDMDKRTYIDEVKKLNGLRTVNLQPGQKIIILEKTQK